MNFEKHGFALLKTRELTEIGGTLFEAEHKRSGARLLWLKRPDDNKTFGIAFTTLPEDSTGVFHILEHSVLCGSRKYPVKEPFVELMKNSMNTFLNAMTYGDKTVYPISSRNDKDFMNLMRVYLDAVFAPLIYDKPEIFCQEGWHYDFDENGVPSYKGVVFNEMKGAYANADTLLEHTMFKMLFPDNCYRFSSGGDPADIPNLTYERFLDFHRRFYAPANSVIFLDGDMDIDAVLEAIDKEYLSRFSLSEAINPPALQQPVNGGRCQVTYELSPEEDPTTKYRVAWGNVIGRFDSREKLVAMSVLLRALCDNNQSPLPKCILEKGLAEDVVADIIDDIYQPCVLLQVKNFSKDKLDEIESTIKSELTRLANEGINRELLVSYMANLEFLLRERDFGTTPKGLVYGITMAQNLLFGGDAAYGIEVGDIFDVLKAKMNDGYFEDLIRTVLLDNGHTACVIMEPSLSAGEARREKEQKRLDAEVAAWSNEQREALIALHKRTAEWQASEDTPEALATLPVLALSDISAEPERIPTDKLEINGTTVLKHAIPCGGIVYCTLYFDASRLSESNLSCAEFLTTLLGELPTEKYTAEKLTAKKQLLFGHLSYDINCYTKQGEPNNTTTLLTVSFNALESNLEQAVELVCEIITATKLDDRTLVSDILKQSKAALMERIVMSGASYALGRVAAQTTVSGVIDEHTNGFCYYEWLKKQDELGVDSLCDELKALSDSLFVMAGLTVSVTGTCDSAAETVISVLDGKLQKGALGQRHEIKPWGKRNEGIIIPADIAFAVKGGNIRENGGKYDGTLPLAARIISLAYLWNVIRVRGGAYGTGLLARQNGITACYSYRDPNALTSLAAYDGAADFLKSFCADDNDLTGFIIGAVSDESPLTTPRVQARIADSAYFTGTSYELRAERRKQLLSASREQLAVDADYIGKTITDGGICVIGGQKQIEACKPDITFTL